MSSPVLAEKPVLRGYFHQIAFFAALGMCALLIARAESFKALAASLVYGFSLCGLFAVSALYHRVQWQPAARMRMRRLDHSFIFVLILGTSVPVSSLAMSSDSGTRFISVVAFAVACGVLQSLVFVNASKWVSIVLYITVGWLVIPHLSELHQTLGPQRLWLLAAGGVTYTAGALVYALKRPNPAPRVFGYHEIFHILVVIAAGFHFAVIWSLVAR